MKYALLPQSFFDRPTLTVARELLGKYIVRKVPASHNDPASTVALMIHEVEAYDGLDDRASHAGRRRYAQMNAAGAAARVNGRAAIMFGPAGRWYTFFTYGVHWMINIVTGPVGHPSAILIRAGVYENKNGTKKIINGPARLTKFIGIDGTFNGKTATRSSNLWIEDRGIHISRSEIISSRRVGVEYAGPIWAKKEWNFKLR